MCSVQDRVVKSRVTLWGVGGGFRLRLQDVFNALPDPFGDFARSLHCAFANVFGTFAGTRADGSGAVDRVKGHHIDRAFRGTCGNIPCSTSRPLPDIACAAADFAARASGFLLVFVMLAGLIRRILIGALSRVA
jgi:hypothetical protein